MRLLLLRHAEAEATAPSDAERVLTPNGREQAALAGVYCQRVGLRPDLVLTSPYQRTVQTGQLVAAAMPGVPMQDADFLASGMEPEVGLPALGAYQHLKTLLIVGHQPDLGLITAVLLGMREGVNLPFALCSLAGLRIGQWVEGGGSLEFFVPLSLMPARG